MTSVIHGEEPALLAELAAHRKLAGLGLRQLAPTVLVSRTPLDKILTALRAAGYAPVAEADDGSVRVERARHRRAATPVPRPRTSPRAPGGTRSPARRAPAVVDVSALAARLRDAPPVAPRRPDDPGNEIPFDSDLDTDTDSGSGSGSEENVARYARLLSLADVRQLAHAIDEGLAVTIEYVAASGNRTVRTLSEIDLDPPHLYAWCHLRDDERVFTLSRVHGVMPA
ncbi:hypothetical protein QF026_004577 [Streptomyces aurantiacus]|uniref:WYL domain-containing protein n=1 Tax=Streptomyces aurantiacus TaxID=47760 RepID=UPI00278D45DE|nr:hypothetical protein [Streptomyces aurantiacus]MDQ0776111.1 hypothetical protein [Streptomyces aurantiacus]